jgi:sterol desaturase/sphingolipid hydroxylase (fatty acid hydroxylase superfamily)
MLFDIFFSFVLTILSIIFPICIQYLLDNSNLEKLNNNVTLEPTSSNLLVVINYCTTWIITCFVIINVSVSWTVTYFDICRIILAPLIIDFFNYAYHYSFHQGILFRYFHYHHHLIRNPKSFRDSTYNGAIDWALSMFAYLSPAAFLEITPAVLIMYFLLTIQIQINHGGYKTKKIPGLISAAEHWAHHQKLKFNFCEITTFFDRIFGTYLPEEEVLKLCDRGH